jgi:hypothetical protein
MKNETIFKKILELKMKQTTEDVKGQIQKLQKLSDETIDSVKEKFKKDTPKKN